MTKYFILNVVLNFAIAFLVYGGIMSFQAGNQLYVFIAIAVLVVMIYLKVVLLKIVKRNTANMSNKGQKKRS
ncbi:DUF6358 family protein [Sphingobacterium suaedae]|uniref:DUF6358 family protein n=1 Tax=Sphingobacterium suaedae TaxID=1686402 RepID=A0ABW5KCH5_9SPHI